MSAGLRMIAELMAVAARTAPKSGGQDFLELRILAGEQLVELATAMDAYGKETGRRNFDRDGRNVGASGALLLVALKGARTLGMNCGACGNDTCAELEAAHEGPEFRGPFCAWRLVDLGIAIGSAVKTAAMLNADNRIMYRAGVVARRLGLIDGDVVVGIPLAATGKNIFFDRP